MDIKHAVDTVVDYILGDSNRLLTGPGDDVFRDLPYSIDAVRHAVRVIADYFRESEKSEMKIELTIVEVLEDGEKFKDELGGLWEYTNCICRNCVQTAGNNSVMGRLEVINKNNILSSPRANTHKIVIPGSRVKNYLGV